MIRQPDLPIGTASTDRLEFFAIESALTIRWPSRFSIVRSRSGRRAREGDLLICPQHADYDDHI